MDFHGIDLNLLAAFDALVSERNVTRAAVRVGVSQPAMSAALSRLRTLFNDPLFLRSAQGLVPTPKARELAGPVSQALQQIKAALLPKEQFEPATSAMTFTLGLSEYPAFVLLPLLTRALEKLGPGLSLSVHAIGSRDSAVDLLDAGTIDAAIGVPPTQAENRILTRSVMRDEFITIVRRGHPAVKDGMSMQVFLALRHVLVSPEGDRHGLVDQALAYLGQRRTLGLALPQMFAAPSMVAQTDMVATVMGRVAGHSPHWRELASFTPPVTLPVIGYDLMWHRRNDAHPAQQWLRDQVAALAAAL
ncbi:LysR family transcriptional regulator [Acidovorax sp. Leaf78]|uniref:LysR family transcriptional regulator n=1 Tax=unclassified Acidovorax TaxID=2684926 RepID=UPI0006FD0FF2|nr:LysR family transcriptional regulator [Acidovorax sp. Leaf78]KQO15965.1 LysR family transcriptional regulator [Acidovorax sp. Leaf78]